MSTPDRSPPTMRVVRLVEALGSRPHRGMTLTELATAVGSNKSTLLNVLAQLVDAGWLTRHGQTYELGPGLITVGRAAEKSPALTAAASHELQLLAARFGLMVTATAPTAADLIVVEIVAPDGGDAAVRRGQRVPFLAPTGAMFVAWDDDLEKRWASMADHLPATLQDQLSEAVRVVRARGYSVERLTEAGEELRQFSVSLDSGVMTDQVRRTVSRLLADLGTREYLEGELADAGTHAVSIIGAPVFGDAAEVLLGISVHPYRDLTLAEIHEMGAACVASAERVAALVRAAHAKRP